MAHTRRGAPWCEGAATGACGRRWVLAGARIALPYSWDTNPARVVAAQYRCRVGGRVTVDQPMDVGVAAIAGRPDGCHIYLITPIPMAKSHLVSTSRRTTMRTAENWRYLGEKAL